MRQFVFSAACGRLMFSCGVTFIVMALRADGSSHDRIVLSTTDSTGSVVANYQEVLSSEISRRSAVIVSSAVGKAIAKVNTGDLADGPTELLVQLHTLDSLAGKPVLPGLPGNRLPSESDPGPEGFLLSRTGNVINIVGVSDRGVLYGIGELLRQAAFGEQFVEWALVRDTRLRNSPGLAHGPKKNGSVPWWDMRWPEPTRFLWDTVPAKMILSISLSAALA
jgi:hypothetical protein